MPLIILDGPDCCGKTTLANKFKEIYGNRCTVTHLSYRMAGQMCLYHLAAVLHSVRRQPDHLHVLDRSWISEEVYGHVYREGPEDRYFNRQLHRIVLKYSGVYILCIPHDLKQYLDFYSHVYSERDEMYELDENVPRIWDCFQSIITANSEEKLEGYSGFLQSNKTTVEPFAAPYWLVYDMFYQDPEEMVKESLSIQADLFYRQLPPFNSPLNHNGGGHMYGAKLIMLGDQVNPKFNRCHYPFVDMGHCSSFLAQQLDLAGIAEEELLWMNVNTAQGNPDPRLPEILRYLKTKNNPPGIVAMGTSAAKALDKAQTKGFTIYSINHPQWYRRFKRHTDLLAETLMNIRNDYDQSLLPKSSKVYTH